MNYYIFKNQFFTHYLAMESGTTDTLEIVFNGDKAQVIKFVEAKPFCGFGTWEPSTISEFNRAYVEASTQMYAHFERCIGHISTSVVSPQKSDNNANS